jgi:ATP-binding cassette subfamily F protein uup
MPLLTLSHARLAFGHHALLDDADFQLDPRERVGLIGRNGTGKSSLLGVLAGRTALDDGALWVAPHARVAWVAQEPLQDAEATVYDTVALGLGAEGKVLTRYHHATALLAEGSDDAQLLEDVGTLHTQLDAIDGWTLGNRIDTVLSKLGLSPDVQIGALSGGWKKRVALAQALAAAPDVLLLDEPTNHLDLAAIAWLESLLQDFAGAVVCVTHDRRFLDAIATRITELDRGRLRNYPGNFAAYQETKAQETADEAVTNAKFDKFLAQEEVWIRKGVQARRTRNEGRVLRLEQLRRDRAVRRERTGQVNLQQEVGERSGKIVAELEHVAKAYGDNVLIRDFSTRILRGDRIGLIGPNGVGKTTLLKLILGEIEPDAGTIRRGTNLTVAYFDQLRDQLNPEASVQETISPGSEWVEIGSVRKHIMTYLGDFLFAPERARSPVRSLSGGERNRLLLARLFARPANVLVLDEPTNDLDIDTLELLEALLQDYPGTVFLVSHDRTFLDNVVTEVIAFEGDGLLREHVGGYSDWVAYQARGKPATKPAETSAAVTPPPREAKTPSAKASSSQSAGKAPQPASPEGAASAPAASAQPKARVARSKLTFTEERELADLPARIQVLEAQVEAMRLRFADPGFYRKAAAEAKALQVELTQLERATAEAYGRWEALEARKAAGTGAGA